MAIKYSMLRIPTDAKLKIKIRANNLSKELTNLTHKKSKVNMTQLIKYYAHQPLELYDSEIIQIFGKNKRNQLNNMKKRTIC